MLEVTELHVRYGSAEAVAGIDLQVTPGAVTLLLGPNGAGKSTTLNTIAGILTPAAGVVTMDGTRISGLPPHQVVRQGVALVPEGRRVFGPLTIEENLRLGGHTSSPSKARETMERVYGMFPILRDRRSSAAGLLSGGEQQMLAFGRALMSEPRVILLDEPSMGLAPSVVDTIMEKVTLMTESGIAVLMVEQNTEAGLEIAADVMVMSRGRIVFRGLADQMRTDASALRAFLGDTALADG